MREHLFALFALLIVISTLNFTVPQDFSLISNVEGCSVGDVRFDELIVGVKGFQHQNYSSLVRLADGFNGIVRSIVRFNGSVEAVVVRLPSAYVGAFTEAVESLVKPSYIEHNSVYRACFVPNDPYWSLQWGLRKIQADFAWNTSIGNSSVLVAVVDTGVDWNHPDLSGNYVALGYDWVNDDSDPMDDNGHGTHVAGIVAAVINNSVGVAGLAQVRIMAEKALNSTGYGSTDELANAIIHAADAGAKIIVMSWGDYFDSILLHNAIKYAYRAGALLVAAAGNDATSNMMYPAAYSEVIAVSATDSSDNLAWFSNFGDWIELSAPGVNIFSTVWDNSYAYKSGTSMAAPFVAGVAALTWSVYPQLSRDNLRLYLHGKADDLGDLGFDIYYGYGRINAWKAVENTTGVHDIAVNSVIPRKNVVGQGMRMRIDTDITNLGDETESFEAMLYANDTEAESLILSLQAREEAVFTFQWNTSGFSKGKYEIGCRVDLLPNELNVSNNAKNSSFMVWVTMIGDITGVNGEPDGKVNIRDIAFIAISYGTYVGDSKWNPNADINDDDKIDIRDVSLAASNFGKVEPQ